MQDEQPDQPGTFGSAESLTFGQMETPEPPMEQRVVGPTGICICTTADLDAMPQVDAACPTHGRGPQTIAEAQRVNEAMRAQFETTGDSGGSPIELAPLGSSRTQDVPSTPQGVDRSPGAPSVEDFPLEEASPEQLTGNVIDVEAHIRALVLRAAQRHSQGEQAEVTSVVMPVPDPNDQSQMAIGVMVVLSVPGMILNTRIINSKILPFIIGWTQEVADEQLREIWEVSRQQRSQQPMALAEMQRRARESNGSAPGGGLILPGM